MINEVIETISANPSNFVLLLMILFVVAALVLGIPAVLSRDIKRVVIVIICTVFATVGPILSCFKAFLIR